MRNLMVEIAQKTGKCSKKVSGAWWAQGITILMYIHIPGLLTPKKKSNRIKKIIKLNVHVQHVSIFKGLYF